MNFQQLRIIREASRCQFNLTEVAKTLYTSQSGISRHIRELEEELGVELFIRHGKRMLGLTGPGKEMLTIARRILDDAGKARRLGELFTGQQDGILTIATTHTQACYSLPDKIKLFRELYPNIRVVLNQGTPEEIRAMVSAGTADLGIASEVLSNSEALRAFPWFKWNHKVLIPRQHPLAGQPDVTLEHLAAWPLITYRSGMTGRSAIDQAFESASLKTDIVLSAQDSDVVKTYVKLGMGIGIVAETAVTDADEGISALDVRHLFAASTVWMAVKRGQLQRDYLWQFMMLCNPNLSVDELKASALQSTASGETAYNFEI
ncbi:MULTISPECIES: LysR substrate-binding domain-containing protein [Tatumella]|uniref:LysR substrate-binding domain-containing protein n=1 Tax=Tatumella punctata TaxID=399969 RepID=A0ABW1VRX9_9GAMM|nr:MULTISPECIES: LysR substrate-binding domain-containing protein [unclassified Tatumella]MBS0856760.1 LysR family transcriptional regulator [Tatumella sp. JGM16]MBS0877768.1 LysR family transcriptional regulator [Tatumella sp. JGM82]MBS0891443.1 LysR family transcriptional regulator [Tatumella sp. JGM94]MBS0894434.1 LysR family transcriptional regulator [Tatumella sp. JGM130]MBS0902403.1 LysR family transcriptional regulator [Tatumella sp. JGM100]